MTITLLRLDVDAAKAMLVDLLTEKKSTLDSAATRIPCNLSLGANSTSYFARSRQRSDYGLERGGWLSWLTMRWGSARRSPGPPTFAHTQKEWLATSSAEAEVPFGTSSR
jgi:hypothetical protein